METQEIQWTSTSARIGWRWLGRTKINPKGAEEIRTAPWLVKRAATTPTDELHEPTASSAVSSTARPMLSPLRLTRVRWAWAAWCTGRTDDTVREADAVRGHARRRSERSEEQSQKMEDRAKVRFAPHVGSGILALTNDSLCT